METPICWTTQQFLCMLQQCRTRRPAEPTGNPARNLRAARQRALWRSNMIYPLVSQHSNGKSLLLIGESPIAGPFSIASFTRSKLNSQLEIWPPDTDWAFQLGTLQATALTTHETHSTFHAKKQREQRERKLALDSLYENGLPGA